MALRFRSFGRTDFGLLESWLAQPHVAAWWQEVESLEQRYGPAIDGTDPTELFIVERGVAGALEGTVEGAVEGPSGTPGEPVAFLHRHLLRDDPEWARALAPTGVPVTAASIDYLIGPEALTGRGLGPAIIEQLVQDTFTRYPDVTAIATSVAEPNRRSWRALEKAHFHRTYTGPIDSDDPSDAGTNVVYVRYRPSPSPSPSPDDIAARFRSLHYGPALHPLLLPNPWDAGSAKVLASLGFEALATTSSGAAATLGRLDGSLTRDEALAHAASIVAATSLPVSADLEHGFADDPARVAETVRLACDCGLAGMSIEDHSGDPDTSAPIYDLGQATERIAAAAEAAHAGPDPRVLTARAENYLHGRPDLADTIERLQRYQQAGADVLYAPGLTTLSDIRSVVASVDRPVNVLARPGTPPVAQMAAIGVRRISVGGAFAFAALGALVDAARELRDAGTYSYTAQSRTGVEQARIAFGP